MYVHTTHRFHDKCQEPIFRRPWASPHAIVPSAMAAEHRVTTRLVAIPRPAELAGGQMTSDGAIVIAAQRFRTQERNRQDALDRLVALIRRAAQPPAPDRHETSARGTESPSRLGGIDHGQEGAALLAGTSDATCPGGAVCNRSYLTRCVFSGASRAVHLRDW